VAEEDGDEENEMEGSVTIHLLRHTERTFRVHTFLWSDGQMTIGGPTKRDQSSRSLYVQLRRSAGVS
jgi:hypothetical protein